MKISKQNIFNCTLAIFLMGCVLVFTLYSQSNYYKNKKRQEYMAQFSQCPTYVPWDFEDYHNCFGPGCDDIKFISCQDLVIIEEWTEDDFYSIGNLKLNNRSSYSIALVKDLDQYTIIEDFLYVVSEKPSEPNIKLGDKPWQYSLNVFVSNTEQVVYYDTVDEVPEYRVINIKTGNMQLYTDYPEMPESAALVFKRLNSSNL